MLSPVKRNWSWTHSCAPTSYGCILLIGSWKKLWMCSEGWLCREKNVVTWKCYDSRDAQQEGMDQEALNIYCAMQNEGMPVPDRVTYLCLQACATKSISAVEKEKQLLCIRPCLQVASVAFVTAILLLRERLYPTNLEDAYLYLVTHNVQWFFLDVFMVVRLLVFHKVQFVLSRMEFCIFKVDSSFTLVYPTSSGSSRGCHLELCCLPCGWSRP